MIGRRLPRSERLRPWREARLLAVDFEASSADPRDAVPLSVGWVPVDRGRVRLADAGYTLIRSSAAESSSVPVHGLLPGELAGAPSSSQVAGALGEALEGRLLVAHGARLELALLARLGVPAHRSRTIDTMRLARRLEDPAGQGAEPALTLASVAARLGVPLGRAHHALADAVAAAQVLLVAATRLEASGAGRVDDLLRAGRAR